MRYQFLNHHCIWKTEGNKYNTDKYCETVCFSNLFSNLYGEDIHQTYYLKVVTDIDFITNTNRNNYCLLGKEKVEKYLRSLELILPTLKWKVSDSTYRGVRRAYECYDITLDFTGSRIEHKYLLTVVRYLWEYPRNVLLRDTMLMKELPEFKFDSVQNLFNLCVMIMYRSDYGLGHGLSISAKYYKNSTLRERLLSAEDLNSIYQSYDIINNIYPEGYENKKKNSYWISDEYFKLRLEKYKKIYKQWKKKSM